MQRLTAIVLGALLLLPHNALAGGFFDGLTQYKKGNLKLGPLGIHPYAGVNEEYDTNIYLVPSDLSGVQQGGGVVQSAITNVNAGVNLDLPVTDMHKFTLGYDFLWKGYHRFSGINNRVNQAASIAYDFKGPFGVYAKVHDKYINTDDPAFSETVEREKRWHNNVGLMVGYKPEGGKLFAEAEGFQERHHYLNGPTLASILDRVEYGFGLKAGYFIMPKTRAYVGYTHRVIHYTNGMWDGITTNSYTGGRAKDSRNHAFNVGVEGKLMQKLKGRIETGINSRRYANGAGNETAADANGNWTHRRGNTNNWTVGAGVNYAPTDRCALDVAYNRSINDSTFGTNRYSIGNKVDINASHKFPYKLRAKLGFGWGVDKYGDAAVVNPNGAPATIAGGQHASRRDDTYTLKMGVGYDIQEWLAADVSYQYDQRFSIFSGQYNYKRHLTALGLKATF
ncbi:MAG: outer membrane beta-barrel protein [Elusimicrobiota bacterium]